jgi:hypothetical protein
MAQLIHGGGKVAEVAAQILSPAQQQQLRSLVELKQRQQKLADRHR